MSYQDKQLKKEFITVDNRTIPFGYPQFWGGDDWEVSGRDNPLPVANYTQNEQGLWVPVSNVNPVPTQLTGSRVEEVVIVDALAITDNTTRFFSQDISDFTKIWAIVENNHNAPVGIRIRFGSSGSGNHSNRYWNGENFIVEPTQELPGDGVFRIYHLFNNLKDVWAGAIAKEITFRIQANEAPTSGALTIKVFGGR